MADRQDDEFGGRQDPVLVRPYIRTEPGGAAPAGHDDRPEETWPEPVPAEDEQPPAAGPKVQPYVPQQATGRRSALLRQRLIVLGGVAVLAFAGAGALFLAAGDDPPPRRPAEAGPTVALPTATGSAGTGVASAGAVRQSAASARGSRATSRPPSRTTTSAAAGTGEGPRDQPAPTGPGSPRPPTATLAPPPAADRTGTIASAGGRCLSLGGLLGIDGSPVQVAGCTGFTAQTFTLAADGTLRVSGRCAQVTDDGEVRSTGCDGRQSAQWRAGPGGSLVNPATGRCLSDPGTAGANTRVADCTGGADQRWTLP